jgi:hypothetical protein
VGKPLSETGRGYPRSADELASPFQPLTRSATTNYSVSYRSFASGDRWTTAVLTRAKGSCPIKQSTHRLPAIVNFGNVLVILNRPMKETQSNPPCSTVRVSTVSLGITGITFVLLALLMNPRSVEAGVVIAQKITTSAAGSPGQTVNHTIMVQDDKEKFVVDAHVSIVIDLNAEKVTLLNSQHKVFRELPFKQVMGTLFDPNHFLYLPFKSTDKTRRVLGFKCQSYTGTKYSGPLMTSVTACFSSDAPGSEEFSHFLKTELERLGHRAQGVSIPAGIPLIIESTHGGNPSFTMRDIAEKDLLAFKSRIAKIPPQLTRQEVTKLTSVKLPLDAFSTPAGYTRQGPAMD